MFKGQLGSDVNKHNIEHANIVPVLHFVFLCWPYPLPNPFYLLYLQHVMLQTTICKMHCHPKSITCPIPQHHPNPQPLRQGIWAPASTGSPSTSHALKTWLICYSMGLCAGSPLHTRTLSVPSPNEMQEFIAAAYVYYLKSKWGYTICVGLANNTQISVESGNMHKGSKWRSPHLN